MEKKPAMLITHQQKMSEEFKICFGLRYSGKNPSTDLELMQTCLKNDIQACKNFTISCFHNMQKSCDENEVGCKAVPN